MTLAQARKKSGLTQAELAERAGRDQALISKLERGEHTNPTHDTIEQLAKALGIAPSLLRFPPTSLRAARVRAGHTDHAEVVR